jgi:beta-carotene hydroxylase
MKLLNYNKDYRALLLVLLSTFLLISPLFRMFASIYWVPLKIIFVIICHAINHSHQHLSVFLNDTLNKLYSVLLSVNIGQSGSATIAMHQLNHHGHNNSDADLANSRLVNYRWNFLNLLLYPFVIIINYRKTKNILLKDLVEKRHGIKQTIAIELWAIRLFAITYCLIDWKAFILFALIPYICGVWAILAINLVQHQLVYESNDYEKATNFTGIFLNYFLFNNGYHSAHHQYPNLHWSILPQRHNEIAMNIPPLFVKRSLLNFLVFHFFLNFSARFKITQNNTNQLAPSFEVIHRLPKQ